MGCHTESGRVEAEHASLGIVDMANCAECHPTGMPGESQQASNFPGKVGVAENIQTVPATESAVQAHEAALPTNEPRTFHYKGDEQAVNKEQGEGASSQP